MHEAKRQNRQLITSIRNQKNLLIGSGLVIALIIIVVLTAVSLGGQNGLSRHEESYKDTSGGAGLEASIRYDCPKEQCEYDFNVYIYKDTGQQVNVVRPDKEGKVHLAMAEGNYVMLIGKLFGTSKVFPQEPLALKNGKTLEMKLEYK